MNLLCVSTAEQGTGIALFRGDSLVCEEYWDSQFTHSKRILPMVEQAVQKRAGLDMDQVDGFIVARGPGSFTGLRIGISVVKGLAHALSKPAIGISSLDGIGFRFCHASMPVCVMMDARRNEVYSAVYRFEKGVLVQKTREMVSSPGQAVKQAGHGALYAGSGSRAFQEEILSLTHGDALFASPAMDSVSASALGVSAFANGLVVLEKGQCLFPLEKDGVGDTLTPVYLRKSDAQIQLEAKKRILT